MMFGKLLPRQHTISQSINTTAYNLKKVINEKLWQRRWICILKPILEYLRFLKWMTPDKLLSERQTLS